LVSRFATRRLIDAAATLDSADRALLNIWINRGLDDAAMARLTGLSVRAIAERRARVVAHLSDELGLPPDHVRSALAEIAVVPDGPAEAPVETANRGPTAPADAPAAHSSGMADAQTSGGSAPGDEQDTAPRPRRRPWIAWSVLTLGVLIVAAVLVVAVGSGESGRRSAVARSSGPSPRTVPSRSTTASARASPSGQSSADRLVALPGGPQRATGTVVLDRARLRLDLTVSNLPPSPGHYEIWLYETVISSQPLGRLRSGATRASVSLPADAHRYPWIDISLQPPGAVFHSGDSILRAANPLFIRAR
jgi:hypothetical protein